MNRSYQKNYKPTKTKKQKIRGSWQQNHGNSILKNKIIFGFILIFLILISAALTFWYLWDIPLTSPLSPLSKFSFLPSEFFKPTQKQRIVYGFLPYWNLNNVIIQPELTHLSYFGLQIGSDGNIITKNSDGTLHPGYNKLDSERLTELSKQVNDNGNQVEIVLVQFDNDTIVKILNTPEAHDNLITSLDSLLLAYPISGVNIDIEYTGEITETLRENFVLLMEKLNNHLDQKYSNVTLSIDMYATAAKEESLWDVDQIGKNVDYIVVMAYDFHRRSSSQAGPVAPLFAGEAAFDLDIHQNLRAFLSQVPKEKILLGIPFYGYEWQTESRSQKSNTYPDTGATATYKRVQEILEKKDELQVETGWDDAALSPYLSYVEDGEIWMIYYEDPTSVSFKLEYVQQLDLAGIAIWALGYEGEHRELWDEIEKRMY